MKNPRKVHKPVQWYVFGPGFGWFEFSGPFFAHTPGVIGSLRSNFTGPEFSQDLENMGVRGGAH